MQDVMINANMGNQENGKGESNIQNQQGLERIKRRKESCQSVLVTKGLQHTRLDKISQISQNANDPFWQGVINY